MSDADPGEGFVRELARLPRVLPACGNAEEGPRGPYAVQGPPVVLPGGKALSVVRVALGAPPSESCQLAFAVHLPLSVLSGIRSLSRHFGS